MNEMDRAKELLNAIHPSDLDYQGWVNVGMALHHENLPCSLWDEWSARDSARYHSGECAKKWRTFGNGSSSVTLGTLYYMAEENGWIKPKSSTAVYGWDDLITDDGDGIDRSGWHRSDTSMELPTIQDDYNPIKDITDYLTALFDLDDHVSYVNQAYKDQDGKWKPVGGVNSRKCGELLEKIKATDDITNVFGTPTEGAGTWICFNPMDGTGRSNKNVSEYRYALVQSDSQDIETQYTTMQDLRLPIRVLVNSGGKSLHAIVRIDACDEKQYKERVDFLYTMCRRNGLDVDTQDKNPARLSRFPGFARGDKMQYIVAKDIGLHDFVEWQHYIMNEEIEPLEVENFADAFSDPKPLKPELIKGILRQGHKMMLVSSSKAGKTFALIGLAVSIAEGIRWFGFECKQGRVLYLNMELDGASFDDRLIREYEAIGVEDAHHENIDIVHLRGKMESMDKLIPQVLRTMKGKKYAAVIIDPIYKLGIGDENAAEEVTKFCNYIDRIANSGASVIYAHHHSKGAQGSKSSMDRASGSGVFARDVDALLDMIQLNIDGEKKQAVIEKYGENATAWKLECTLREFPRVAPVNIFFSYPVHVVDDGGILDDARLAEDERALNHGRTIGAISNTSKKEDNKSRFMQMLEGDKQFGYIKSIKEYAKEFVVTDRTIRIWLEEMGIGVKNSYPDL